MYIIKTSIKKTRFAKAMSRARIEMVAVEEGLPAAHDIVPLKSIVWKHISNCLRGAASTLSSKGTPHALSATMGLRT